MFLNETTPNIPVHGPAGHHQVSYRIQKSYLNIAYKSLVSQILFGPDFILLVSSIIKLNGTWTIFLWKSYKSNILPVLKKYYLNCRGHRKVFILPKYFKMQYKTSLYICRAFEKIATMFWVVTSKYSLWYKILSIW